jgi:error-prone DNA polymerase
MAGRVICQWDKDGCDDAGFVKIDFLALGMLSLVEECLELVWEGRGEVVDLGAIPYDDPAIYEAICAGDTVGLFQIESRAQIQMLPRTRPRSLDDLAVQVAIVRPGPIVGGAVNPYVQRRERQRQFPTYQPKADHPLLNEILRDTLGIILYQDQVLEVAMRLGQFTAGQADQFRRAMSRRRSHALMASFRDAFLRGAARQNVPVKTAERIFEKLLSFSEFGFPKSHAYAFAVLAYQSAWLRHKYPAEYYAALFNNQPMGFYAPHVLVGDAKRRGIQVLRVAINASRIRSSARNGQILLGLTTVRGLSTEAAETIVAERDANGAYRSLRDLLRRTGIPRALIERLINVGALADLGLNRRELLWQLGLLSPAGRGVRVKGRQLALPLPVDHDMVTLSDMRPWERMVADYEILGLSPSFHPFGLVRRRLADDIWTAAELRQAPNGVVVRTAGMVVCRQRPETAKGYIFLLLEDETGLTSVIVRPDLYEAARSVVRGELYLCVEGVIRFDPVTDHADRPLAALRQPVADARRPRLGTLNLIASRVTLLRETPDALLPRPSPRRPHPGRSHDPREAAAIGSDVTNAHASFRDLDLVTPPSHDFH